MGLGANCLACLLSVYMYSLIKLPYARNIIIFTCLPTLQHRQSCLTLNRENISLSQSVSIYHILRSPGNTSWVLSCTITMKLQHEALLSEAISRSRCSFSVVPASTQKRRETSHYMQTSLFVLTLPVPFSRHVEVVLPLHRCSCPTYPKAYGAGSLAEQ